MVDTKIRLNIFSAAKDGEALYSQQKQDQELTVAQIMNSLLPKRSLVSRLVNCNSILFSRFWIIFTIIILNSFSGRLPISSSLVWFGGHLSCSFTCWVFLCFFILFRLLCLGWPFCILAVWGSSLLGRFLAVGRVGQVACQGLLVRKFASVFWWVELDLFSLECNKVSSSEF